VIVKIGAIFFLSLSIGILYRVPKALLFYGAVVGVTGWLTLQAILGLNGSIVIGCFVGSLVVALCSELLARRLRRPATIFLIPGFIPLVPGLEGYLTMLAMVRGNYLEGIEMAMRTVFMGGAIAMGIFVISTIVHTVSVLQTREEKQDAS